MIISRPAAILTRTFFVSCLFISPTMAGEKDRPDSARLLAQAENQMKEGDLAGARFLLKKAAALDPHNGRVRLELGRVQLDLGEYLAAEKEFISARAGKVPAAAVDPLLGTTLLAEGKFQKVLDISPCPNDPVCGAEILALHARAHLGQNAAKDAEKAADAALALKPNAASSRVASAMIAKYARNDPAQARRLVDAVLADGDEADALTLKGELLEESGDSAGALASFRRSIKMRPHDLNAQVHLVTLLMELDRDDEAAAGIEQILQQSYATASDYTDPESSENDRSIARALAVAPKRVMGLYLKSLLLVRANKMAEAMDTIRPVEFLTALTVPNSKFLLALIHAANDSTEQALQYAGSFRTDNPHSLIAIKLHARIYGQAGDFGKVVETLTPVRDQLLDDPDILKLLGAANLATGHFSEANDIFSLALKSRPLDPMISAGKSVALTGQGATREQGLRELEQLVQTNPGNAQMDFILLSSVFASGDYQRAIRIASDMATRQPNAPEPLVLRGAAKQAMGEDSAAMTDFQSALTKDPAFSPAALFAAAMKMRDGDIDSARRFLDGVLARHPGDLPVLLMRANLEKSVGQFDAAISSLKTAIERNAAALDARAGLIELYIAKGDTAKALTAAADLVTADPANFAMVDYAATMAIKLGKVEDGVKYFDYLLASHQSDAKISFRYGHVLASLGRLEEASRVLARSVADDPTLIEAWSTYANTEFLLKGERAAMEIASKAIARNIRNENAAVLPGDIQRWAGHADKATQIYRDVYIRMPSPVSVGRLFHVLADSGNSAEADRIIEEWLAKNPEDLMSRFDYAQDKLQRGDLRGAAAQYQIIVAKSPRDAMALNNLGWVYDQLNDSRALEIAKRAYHLAPDKPEIMDTYFSLLYRKGDRKQGFARMALAHKATPDDPQIAFHFAQMLKEEGKPEEARRVMTPLIEKKVSFPEAEAAQAFYASLRPL